MPNKILLLTHDAVEALERDGEGRRFPDGRKIIVALQEP